MRMVDCWHMWCTCCACTDAGWLSCRRSARIFSISCPSATWTTTTCRWLWFWSTGSAWSYLWSACCASSLWTTVKPAIIYHSYTTAAISTCQARRCQVPVATQWYSQFDLDISNLCGYCVNLISILLTLLTCDTEQWMPKYQHKVRNNSKPRFVIRMYDSIDSNIFDSIGWWRAAHKWLENWHAGYGDGTRTGTDVMCLLMWVCIASRHVFFVFYMVFQN